MVAILYYTCALGVVLARCGDARKRVNAGYDLRVG